ncbi:MAG: hypothetical protein ACOC8K_07055 [Gemmatimonadota bacterium]
MKRKSGKLRPLHLPSPVPVRADDRGRPVTVGPADGSGTGSRAGSAAGSSTGSAAGSHEGGMKEVVQIREIWRIDDEWWREPVSRLYFEVVLEDGKRAVLYRDLTDGRWYRQ